MTEGALRDGFGLTSQSGDSHGGCKSLAASEGAELVRRCRAGDGAAVGRDCQSYSGYL